MVETKSPAVTLLATSAMATTTSPSKHQALYLNPAAPSDKSDQQGPA